MRSRIIPESVLQDLHFQAAQSLLADVLPWGDLGAIASNAGISQSYFSRIRNPEYPPPSPRTVASVARVLFKDTEEKNDLIRHWLASQQVPFSTRGGIPTDVDWLRTHAVGELNRLNMLATYAQTADEASHWYQALVRLGEVLIEDLHLAGLHLQAVRTHTLLSDTYSAFNRPGEGIFHSRLAQFILHSLEESQPIPNMVYYDPLGAVDQEMTFAELQVNSIRVEAVAHNAIKAHQTAENVTELALGTQEAKSNPEFWSPHIYRDKITAMSRNPKHSIGQVYQEWKKGTGYTEQTGDELGTLLLNRCLARAFYLRGFEKNAERVLQAELERLSTPASIGQLHKAMLYAEMAIFYHSLGDVNSWSVFLKQAWDLAQRCNFRKIKKDVSVAFQHEPLFWKIAGLTQAPH